MKKIVQTSLLFLCISFTILANAQSDSNAIVTQFNEETLFAYNDSIPGTYYLNEYGALWQIVKHNDGSMDLNYYGQAPKNIIFPPQDVKRLINRDTVSYVTLPKHKPVEVVQYYLPPGKDVAQKILLH